MCSLDAGVDPRAQNCLNHIASSNVVHYISTLKSTCHDSITELILLKEVKFFLTRLVSKL